MLQWEAKEWKKNVEKKMQKMQMINDNERDFPGDVNCYTLTPAGEDRWAVASERSLSGNIPPKNVHEILK